MTHKILALDLEGTIISNAVSIFVRPNLFNFLVFCSKHFERIILFTAVSAHRVREIQKILTEEGSVPKWFKDLEVVEWEGNYKDLRFVKNCDLNNIIIIDDQEKYILYEQKSKWIKIKEWLPPFENSDDSALSEIQQQILEKIIF